MRPIHVPPGVCTIDPITLGSIALGTLIGGGAAAATSAFSSSSSGSPSAAPTQPSPAPAPSQPAAPPASAPAGGISKQQGTPTFIGANAAPVQAFGQKTLLGQ